jgi:hypothetical protein
MALIDGIRLRTGERSQTFRCSLSWSDSPET